MPSLPQPPRTSARRVLTTLITTAVVFSLVTGCGLRRPKVGDGPKGPVQRGKASWYGKPFHGRATASGEIYDMHGLSAAHRALPLGTLVRVTHLGNGRSVTVTINDRGPFVRGRIIDLSRGAAEAIGMVIEGIAEVEVRVVRDAPDPDHGKEYVVQIGAFRDRDNALDLKLRVQSSLPEAWIVTRGGLHRVYIGPYDRKRDAEAARRQARKHGHDAVLLTRPAGSSQR